MKILPILTKTKYGLKIVLMLEEIKKFFKAFKK